MAGRGRLILTLDAFGTLFKPKQPISRQYAELAWRHGLSDIAEEQIRQNFKRGITSTSTACQHVFDVWSLLIFVKRSTEHSMTIRTTAERWAWERPNGGLM